METPNPKIRAIDDSPDNLAERRRAQEALRDSETRYRRLFEAARDGILILDAETGMIVDVNPFLSELLGYSHEQFLGKAIWDLGCFRDVIANLDKFLELQRQEYVRYENLPLETADGRRIEVEFVSNVYLVDHKKVVQCNIRDMTEHRRAERALRESEARFAQLATQSGVIVWEVDSHGLYTHVSHVSESIWGYRPDEIVGRMHFYDLHPEAGREAFKKATFAVFERKEPFQSAVSATQTKDGRVVWVSTNGIPVLNPDGTLRGYRGSDTDVSERKLAEDELRSTRAFLDSVINAIADPVFVKDDKRRFILVNDALCAIVGRPREALLGEDGDDMFPKEQVVVFRKMDAGVLDTGEENVNEEHLSDLATGDVRTIVTRKTRYVDPAGKRVLVGVIRDITERKLAEDAVHRERDRAERYLDTVETIIVALNPEGRITTINRKCRELFGRSEEELAGEFWFLTCLPQPEGMETVYPIFLRMMAGESEPFAHFENPIIAKSGERRQIAWHNAMLRDEQGRITGVLSAGEDITERRLAEEALRKSEAQLRLALDSASAVAWMSDFGDGTVTETGPVERVFGKPAGFRHLDEASFLQDIHPDDRARVIASLQAGKQAFSVEYRVPLSDGGVRWLQASGRFEYDSGGRPARLLGIAIDITEHRRAKERIESQLAELQRWQDAMLDREDRVQELKREVNELSRRVGEPARYPSQEAGPAEAEGAEPS